LKVITTGNGSIGRSELLPYYFGHTMFTTLSKNVQWSITWSRFHPMNFTSATDWIDHFPPPVTLLPLAPSRSSAHRYTTHTSQQTRLQPAFHRG